TFALRASSVPAESRKSSSPPFRRCSAMCWPSLSRLYPLQPFGSLIVSVLISLSPRHVSIGTRVRVLDLLPFRLPVRLRGRTATVAGKRLRIHLRKPLLIRSLVKRTLCVGSRHNIVREATGLLYMVGNLAERECGLLWRRTVDRNVRVRFEEARNLWGELG